MIKVQLSEMQLRMSQFFIGVLCLMPLVLFGQSDDSYTRYELLDPATQSFRILYDVTITEPGSAFYYNTLRKGSEHQVAMVKDLSTGMNLEWVILTGDKAKSAGFSSADLATDYLQVKLARPVTEGSEYRIRIDKTYKDPNSYFIRDQKLVFKRALGIKRNAVVLPKGYEIISCNFPSQVGLEPDGRIRTSFINPGAGEVPLQIEARKLPSSADLTFHASPASTAGEGKGRDKSKARVDYTLAERAAQTREIVYFLLDPATHSFRLYHDYTESRAGMDHYLNIVRAGSKASNPSAKILDNGIPLKVETLRGDEITRNGLDPGEPVTSDTEVVVIWYPSVKEGQTTRLRIEETYTDPNRYLLNNDELVFDRSFGRPFNTVKLPPGWFLTMNVVPATIHYDNDGLISLDYVNGSPDEIDVLIRARKR
ncbi:MAG: hypothetical protein JST14_08695 [Bacteroidetes bacterium]|nr:hypothetical protein [Bacteroidota bacterium]